MKEVIITKYGAPSVLQVREKRNPNPREGEVLVRNHFTGVNFSEIMARMRLYPGAPKPPTTLGAEACGIVESVGKNDNIKFIDEYDKTGVRLEKDKKKMKTMTEFTKTKSYTSGFH